MSYIGSRLREYRLRIKMSQRELSKRSGCPQSVISRIETGDHQPDDLELASLTKALNTPCLVADAIRSSRSYRAALELVGVDPDQCSVVNFVKTIEFDLKSLEAIAPVLNQGAGGDLKVAARETVIHMVKTTRLLLLSIDLL